MGLLNLAPDFDILIQEFGEHRFGSTTWDPKIPAVSATNNDFAKGVASIWHLISISSSGKMTRILPETRRGCRVLSKRFK